MLQEVRVKFIEKIKRTETVRSFRFKSEQKIDFYPGQFLQVIFDEQNKNNRNLNKYLSFSSAPGKDYIEVTKKISDSKFSQRLLELKPGSRILMKAPMGTCIFKDEYEKIGFLIGGIGITAVISILEYIIDKGLATDVYLLYSNKIEDDIAFKPEIDNWSKNNSKIKVIYTVSTAGNGEIKDKRCFFGRINKQLFMSKVTHYNQRIFFIFGPPNMVTAMKDLCLEMGRLKEMVKTENFIGY